MEEDEQGLPQLQQADAVGGILFIPPNFFPAGPGISLVD